MSLFSPPTPPSPSAGLGPAKQVGNLQQGFNVASQAGSMVGQNDPWGSLQYTQVGTGPNGVPLYNANQNLAPAQQALLDQQNINRMIQGGNAAGLLSEANYGQSNPIADILGLTGGISSGILGQEVNYLNPFFRMQRNQEETQLQNQGFTPGDTPGSQGSAWFNAMMPLEASQGLTVSNFLANAEPQAFNQASSLFTLPEQMATTMMGNAAPTMPGSEYVQTPQLGSVNEVGAYQAAQSALEQQYAAQQQQYNNMMGGIFGIPTAILGGMGQAGAFGGAGALLRSDRRIKRDLKLIGRHKKGFGIYRFKYLWSPVEHIGVIAQEVQPVVPLAVMTGIDGHLLVNYAEL